MGPPFRFKIFASFLYQIDDLKTNFFVSVAAFPKTRTSRGKTEGKYEAY